MNNGAVDVATIEREIIESAGATALWPRPTQVDQHAGSRHQRHFYVEHKAWSGHAMHTQRSARARNCHVNSALLIADGSSEDDPRTLRVLIAPLILAYTQCCDAKCGNIERAETFQSLSLSVGAAHSNSRNALRHSRDQHRQSTRRNRRRHCNAQTRSSTNSNSKVNAYGNAALMKKTQWRQCECASLFG